VPLPAGLELAAYRVVQEGLTNVVKHAGEAHATVLIRFAASGLEIEVADDGRGEVTGTSGRGLVGLRERILLYGGELEAGGAGDRGYLLRARIPLGDRVT